MLTDPFELIKQMPAGSAVYARAGQKSDSMETCILIREDDSQIKRIRKNPIIELRSGLWESHVCVVALMVKLAGLPYETWWNYHQEGGGEKYFEDMTRQLTLPILVYDEQSKRRSVMVRNSLSSIFRSYADKLRLKPPWSMKAFDAARDRIYDEHATVIDLWNALACPGDIA